jgi:hypothetical protein
MVVKKRIRSKVKRSKVKRVKRINRCSLKRKSFKNTKRTKRKKRTRRTKRMKGGMEAARGETLESECYTVGQSGKWNKRYAVLDSNSLMIYLNQTKQGPARSGSVENLSFLLSQMIQANRSSGSLNFRVSLLKPRTKWGIMGKDYYEFQLGKRYIFEEIEMRDRFLEGITNISQGRNWDLSAEDAEEEAAKLAAEEEAARLVAEEEAARLAAEAEAARLAAEEEAARLAAEAEAAKAEEEKIMKATQEFSSIEWDNYEKLISLLNDLLPFNIKSIHSFNRGFEGLIIVVTIEGDSLKVLKIGMAGLGKGCDKDRTEYEFIDKVNSIKSDITARAEEFYFITDLRFVIGLKMLLVEYEKISQKHAGPKDIKMELGYKFRSVLQNNHRPKQLSFSITVMEYLDGVTFGEFLKSKMRPGVTLREFWKSEVSIIDTDTSKVLEDFRKKINLLHRNGIYHCDLHHRNVMVLKDLSVRIIDFGNSRQIDRGESTPEWGEWPCWSGLASPFPPSEIPETFVEKHCPKPWYTEEPTCLDQ